MGFNALSSSSIAASVRRPSPNSRAKVCLNWVWDCLRCESNHRQILAKFMVYLVFVPRVCCDELVVLYVFRVR